MSRILLRALPALAWRAWFTPPPRRPRTAVELPPTRVAGRKAFTTGTGPLALVLHGWGGTGEQMGSVAEVLAAEGYRVVVPELPGAASMARADLKQLVTAIDQVIEEVGEPDIVVVHSFAALALRLVYSRRSPRLVVMVAPLLDVDDALDKFGDVLGLFPWTRTALRRRLREWDPQLFEAVSGIHPEQLPGARLLILHDPDDPQTSFRNAATLAARRPETAIVSLEGSGHNRILGAEAALDAIRTFIDRSRSSAA